MRLTSSPGEETPATGAVSGPPPSADTLYSNGLRDITSGNNDTDGLLEGQFAAGPGWDACSGWGTPDGGKLLAALKSPGSGS